jgi:hypothetical protein
MIFVQALERRFFGLAPASYHADTLLLYALACAHASFTARLGGTLRVHRSARERDEADRTTWLAHSAPIPTTPPLSSASSITTSSSAASKPRAHTLALDALKFGDGGGIGKARRCAALEREARGGVASPAQRQHVFVFQSTEPSLARSTMFQSF